MGRKSAILRDNHRRRGERMKSHIYGSTLDSKSSIQEAIEHRDMQQVLLVFELCWAIAVNEVLGVGNERLKRVEQYKQEVLTKFERYASSTGKTRAKGYTDMDTAIEWLIGVAKSRNIDIASVGIRRIGNE